LVVRDDDSRYNHAFFFIRNNDNLDTRLVANLGRRRIANRVGTPPVECFRDNDCGRVV
jgi:hypothetical protein